MHPILRNTLAVISGLVLGSVVNMILINLGPRIIATPEGFDVTTMEGLKASMHLLKPVNFIFPFLAHALGTFVGALITAKIVKTSKMLFALIIGLFFLVGGTINVMMLPAPMWFNIIDLCFAYLPMAYFGAKFAK